MNQAFDSQPTERPVVVHIWKAVSSGPQAAEDKVSLQAQENAGREFAEAIGGIVGRVYEVPGHTRDIVLWEEAEREMEAYRQIRKDCKDHTFDILYVTDPDRLGRTPALAHQVLALVEKSGAEVYTASAPHVVGHKGTGHNYIFSIQAVRASEDQRRRVEYLRTGMSGRVRRGLHASNWPTGYRPIRDNSGRVNGAELDPDEAGAIRLLTECFLAGDPYGKVARKLDESPYRPRRSETWDPRTIYDILHNDFYAGYPSWSDQKAESPSNLYPALWDLQTHAAIIRERKAREAAKGRRETSPFYKVAFCVRCGKPMYRGRVRGRPSVQCSTYKRTSPSQCHPNTILEQTMKAATIAYLERMIDDTVLETALGNIEADQSLQERLSDTRQRIESTNHKRTRLALSLASGVMDSAVYQNADRILRQDLHKLQQERQQLELEIAHIPEIGQRREALDALRNTVSRLFTLPTQQGNAMLRAAGIHINCEGGRIVAIVLS
jgi:DNA invertase Pin-like site-specific DNA recombinase